MNNFYITAAIDYPNALPHIGTSFEKIGADVQARYRRMKGDKVYFLMGNDENTVKVYQKAKSLNVDTQEYCNAMAKDFRLIWDELDITYTDFIQTSEPRHRNVVEAFICAVNKTPGLIYKQNYHAPYCEGCEEFKTETNLANNRCPNHPNQDLKVVEEENYFFALSKFKDRLKAAITNREIIIKPETRFNEVMNMIGTGLKDISITRKNIPWGIPVPWDKEQTIYVWFDALLSYLTGSGKDFQHWPADIHFIGMDITRFHCLLWPAMLMAADMPLPKQIYAHGFIQQKLHGNLVKTSKSGNWTNPAELIHLVGSDAYRYYFMSKCPFGGGGEFDRQHFIEVYNADLANNLGNVVSRVVQLILLGFDGTLPKADCAKVSWESADGWVERWTGHMEECRYKDALEMTWEILRDTNNTIEGARLWELVKNEPLKSNWLLRACVAALKMTAFTIKPFLPKTADKIMNTFRMEDEPKFDLKSLESFARNPYMLSGNNPITINKDLLKDGKYPPLFARIKQPKG